MMRISNYIHICGASQGRLFKEATTNHHTWALSWLTSHLCLILFSPPHLCVLSCFLRFSSGETESNHQSIFLWLNHCKPCAIIRFQRRNIHTSVSRSWVHTLNPRPRTSLGVSRSLRWTPHMQHTALGRVHTLTFSTVADGDGVA